MEILALVVIGLIWAFKAAVANEDKKVNDRETGSISSTPDELIKKATRTADDTAKDACALAGLIVDVSSHGDLLTASFFVRHILLCSGSLPRRAA